MAEDTTQRLDEARAGLVESIETAGIEPSGQDPGNADPLVKAGSRGFSFELDYNGVTIPLAGRDVNELSIDEFQPFLRERKLRVEAGESDEHIRKALAAGGPGKAVAKVRAIDRD